MNLNFVFMPAALEVLRRELGVSPGDDASWQLPSTLHEMPIAGDLLSDPRVSRHLFVVVNRMFMWNESAQQYDLQLLLDIAPNSSVPPQLTGVRQL